MKKRLSISALLFVTNFTYAQNIISSSAYVQTCIQKTNCFSSTNTSYLFYDDTKEELILKIDFNTFKTGKDSSDNWMEDLNGTHFYFIAHVNKNEFNGLGNNASKSIKANGSIYFNEVWQTTITELTVFEIAENSLLTKNTNENSFDRFKINFGLSFLPKNFKMHKGAHHLKKTITIGIAGGRINQLKPELKDLLKDLNKK